MIFVPFTFMIHTRVDFIALKSHLCNLNKHIQYLFNTEPGGMLLFSHFWSLTKLCSPFTFTEKNSMNILQSISFCVSQKKVIQVYVTTENYSCNSKTSALAFALRYYLQAIYNLQTTRQLMPRTITNTSSKGKGVKHRLSKQCH